MSNGKVGDGRLEIPRIFHTFGLTKPGDSPSTVFQIRNTGEVPLQLVGRPVASCSCAVANLPNNAEIGIGETLEIPVTLNLGRGHSNQTVTAEVKNVNDPSTVRVSFRVFAVQEESIDVIPGGLDFGLIEPNSSPIQSIRLQESPVDLLEIESIESSTQGLEITMEPHGNGSGWGHLILRVKADPRRLPMTGSSEITVKTTSRLRPVITIPVKFRLRDVVTVYPSALAWTSVPVGRAGETKTVQLEIAEAGLASVTVDESPNHMVVVKSLEKNSFTLSVTPYHSGAGPHQWAMKVTITNDEASEPRRIAILCSSLAVDE